VLPLSATDGNTDYQGCYDLLRFLLIVRLCLATTLAADVRFAFQRACREVRAKVDTDEVCESLNYVFELADTILRVADAFE